MRDPAKRLEVLEEMIATCIEGIDSLPKKVGKKDAVSLAVAKTKYIGVATTAIKEMGSIVRKEFSGDDKKLAKRINGAKTVAELQALAKEITFDQSPNPGPILKA